MSEGEEYKVTAFDLKLGLLQYFRFKRQWLCVDEFRGADIIADTGKEIIEVEVKISRNDLINGEKKKARKHERYKSGNAGKWGQWVFPNRFMVCVPESLVEVALGWANEINPAYGVIGFGSERLLRYIELNCFIRHGEFVRIARSAKKLHEQYHDKIRWDIAKRASSKIATLMQQQFKYRLEK